jgi:hypothetical protein
MPKFIIVSMWLSVTIMPTGRQREEKDLSSILDSTARLRERNAGTPQRTNATSDNYMDSMGKTTRRRSRSIVAITRNPVLNSEIYAG